MKEDSTIHLFMGKKEITLKDGRVGKIIKIEETREDIPFRGFNSRAILYIKGKVKKEVTLLIDGKEETFNIDVLMKLIKTKENKMEWIPFSIKEDEDLIRGNDYLVTDLYGERAVMEYRPNVWKQRNIKAYMELPEAYRPKTLKDRLDEAIEKYCYEFSDKEWKDDDSKQYFIAYNFDGECFEIEAFGNYTTFAPYYFLDILKAQAFVNSFTTEELLQVMKGEVR